MMNIRNATIDDAGAILEIYNPYILNTVITFEESPVGIEEMQARILKNGTDYAWLVYESGGAILGYAYASRWRERCAYRSSAESTVYVREGFHRQGIGRSLYSGLLDRLRAKDVHLVIGGISLPNESSVALHESLGFQKAAHFPEVGYKFGRWLDVGYWTLLLSGKP